jgi:hypothetical protein
MTLAVMMAPDCMQSTETTLAKDYMLALSLDCVGITAADLHNDGF